MLLDIPATLQISTHVLTGRVAGLSSKSNMDIGSTLLLDIRHVADLLPTCQQVICSDMSAQYPVDSFLCHVANMLADMSATRRPDRHMSVVLTLVSTRRHPTLPAKLIASDSFSVFWDFVGTVEFLFAQIRWDDGQTAIGDHGMRKAHSVGS